MPTVSHCLAASPGSPPSLLHPLAPPLPCPVLPCPAKKQEHMCVWKSGNGWPAPTAPPFLVSSSFSHAHMYIFGAWDP